MMTSILALWAFMGPSITLSPDIESVDKIVRHGSALFVLDRSSHLVTKTSDQGDLINIYDRRGEGPGEFYKLTGLSVVGNEVFLCDFNGKLIVTDLDLNFLREQKVDLRIWDLEATERGFYLVGFSGSSQKMVSFFDRDFKEIKTFGDPLKSSPKGYHFDNGRLIQYSGHFYFVHFFVLGVQVFSSDGGLDYISYPPHIEDYESALLFSGAGKNLDASRAIKKVSCTRSGVICLYKRKDELDGWEAIRFSIETQKWLAPVNDPMVVVSDLAHDYTISRDEQDRIRLTVQP